jgi:Zn-dependent peptidase ImmA (M78 family)/predicted secreted protein
MPTWRDAVLEGVKEAARLHEQLGLRSQIEATPGSIDVFAAIVQLNIPLMFRPLDGLLGTFLPKPAPGIMVTTERSLAIQRFTSAHELGHCYMGHEFSLDDNSILGRSPFGSRSYDPREAAADAFAASFLVPKWLLQIHAARHEWNARSMHDAPTVYQLSLRLGTSFDATCRSLRHHDIIDADTMASLLDIRPKKIKQHILDGYEMENWHPDVWVLTEADSATRIQGGPDDVFVLKLRENSGAGYLWNLEQLEAAGFVIVTDIRHIPGQEEAVGGVVERILTARLNEPDHGRSGRISLIETRPWAESDGPAEQLTLIYDLYGKESGRPRAERHRLAAA